LHYSFRYCLSSSYTWPDLHLYGYLLKIFVLLPCGLDDLPVDIADQVGAEVRDLVITGSVENSMLRPGEQEFFLDLLNGHLVYFEVISKMKTVTANRKLLLSKAGELENTDLQAAKVLRAVAD
jgi:hypothetical protein